MTLDREHLELYVAPEEHDEPSRIGWLPVLLVVAIVLAAIVWRSVR